MSIDVFEPGFTQQFTFQSSVAPDAAPSFAVYDNTDTLVSSLTSQQSDSTHYYAMYTMPANQGIYAGEWVAKSTLASIGSTFNFGKRVLFSVVKTRSQA